MERITDQEKNRLINQEKEKIKKLIQDGGKVVNIITYEKDKTTTQRKIELANGKSTSSKIEIEKDRIAINS